MAIVNLNDKFCNWYYKTDTIQFLIQGEVIDLIPDALLGMSLVHSYNENVFPIFSVEININDKLYHKIIENKNKLKLRLRIKKYYQEISRSTKSMMRNFIDDTFDLILDDVNENLDMDSELVNTSNDLKNLHQNVDSNLERRNNYRVSFYLFKTDLIEKTRKPINTILSDASPVDALIYILQKQGIKNILMSPADNIEKRESIIIPPLKTIDAIRFIDSYYGLYKNGSMIYFDFNTSYILDYSGRCTAYRKNETKETCIFIPSNLSIYRVSTGSVIKENKSNKNYIIATPSSLTIRNESISNNILDGSDIMVINNIDGSVEKSDNNDTFIDNKIMSVISNKTENPYIISMFNTRVKSKNIVIELGITDYDIDVLTPNKRISIVFEDSKLAKKYNYNYRLSQVAHVFVKSGESFSVRSSLSMNAV